MPVLKYTIDTYKSAELVDEVLLGKAPVDPLEFESNLFETLNEFKAKGTCDFNQRSKILMLETSRSERSLVETRIETSGSSCSCDQSWVLLPFCHLRIVNSSSMVTER